MFTKATLAVPWLGRVGEGETPLLSMNSDANGKDTGTKAIAQANLDTRLTEESPRAKSATIK